MKQKKILLRALALCVAIACTLTVVAALGMYDLNRDGKTNVWDLQMAVTQNKSAAEKDAALLEALGGKDELHPVKDNYYEIYTPLGLYNMAKLINKDGAAGKTFELKNDIDMGGAAWQSTKFFTGTFVGNGHTISNVNVYGEIVLGTSGTTTTYSQGFFGKIGKGGLVQDLKLENVTNILTEESKASYVGLLTGSLSGEIKNCTTVGTVIDPRTTLEATCYVGTLAGRIESVSSYTVPGITITDDSIQMTAETPEITKISGKSQKVLCKMGMEFAQLSYPEGTETSKQFKRQLGIAGWAPGTAGQADSKWPEAYKWQDISGATTVVGKSGTVYNLEDPILTARRQAVVDKMYEICTVEWTPSQTMSIVYYKVDPADKGQLAFSTATWEKGKVYRGMPYNHGSGSLERFEAWMDVGADGRLVTKTTLPTMSYYYTHEDVRNAMTKNGASATYKDPNYSFGIGDTGKYMAAGYLKYVGTDLVYDLSLGYKLSDQPMIEGEPVESADHAGFSRYIGNDCSQAIQWAWREVVSSDVKNGGTVISGVTQMAPTKTYQTRHGVLPVGGLVPSGYSVAAWCEVLDTYGKTAVLEAYAHASKGDALIVDQVAGGHSRMIAYDPICIRNYRSTISEKDSYIITYEQGHSSSGTDKNGVAWKSTCHVDRVLTFETLLDEADHKATPNGSACQHYYPMTIPAFHNVDNKAVTSSVTYKNGIVKSNFYIISTTVDGNEVFTAVGQHNNITPDNTWVGEGYREAQIQVDAAKTHGELAGKTISVRLSNGDIYTVNADTGAVTKN